MFYSISWSSIVILTALEEILLKQTLRNKSNDLGKILRRGLGKRTKRKKETGESKKRAARRQNNRKESGVRTKGRGENRALQKLKQMKILYNKE